MGAAFARLSKEVQAADSHLPLRVQRPACTRHVRQLEAGRSPRQSVPPLALPRDVHPRKGILQLLREQRESC